jgi:hypothetical protein
VLDDRRRDLHRVDGLDPERRRERPDRESRDPVEEVADELVELGRPEDGRRDRTLLDRPLGRELAFVVRERDVVDAHDRHVQEVLHVRVRSRLEQPFGPADVDGLRIAGRCRCSVDDDVRVLDGATDAGPGREVQFAPPLVVRRRRPGRRAHVVTRLPESRQEHLTEPASRTREQRRSHGVTVRELGETG